METKHLATWSSWGNSVRLYCFWFTQSLVKNNVQLNVSSSFSGSGKNLFDIPLSALSETSPLIASGSVSASVSPVDGFVVTSIDSGSIFFGDVKVQSGSAFSGSGKDLFDIPRSAITEEAFRIVSGSVTASVHPIKGFEVNSTGRFDGGITTSGSLIIVMARKSDYMADVIE